MAGERVDFLLQACPCAYGQGEQGLDDSEMLQIVDLAINVCNLHMLLSILQVYILDAVAKMSITDAKDAESIVERVIPRLQHANSAVVLSAVKVGCSNSAAAQMRH